MSLATVQPHVGSHVLIYIAWGFLALICVWIVRAAVQAWAIWDRERREDRQAESEKRKGTK